MPLSQAGLGTVTWVSAGTSEACYTVGSAKTAYIRSVLIHSFNATDSQNAAVHVVPNTGGSYVAGTATSLTQIAKLGIGTDDTYFLELAYPLTLSSNGDSLVVDNKGAEGLNVVVIGDKEL